MFSEDQSLYGRACEGSYTDEGGPGQAAELEAVFNLMVDGLLVIGLDGTILRANPEAETFFGGNLQGMDRCEFARRIQLCHLDGRPVEPAEIPSVRVLAGQTVRNERYLCTGAQGRTVTVLLSGAPIRSRGKVTGAVMVVRDVSEQQRLAEKVDELQRQQVGFLRALSHAVRTPLSVIFNQAEIIRQQPAEPKEKRLRRVDSIAANVRRISAMIDEFLAPPTGG